MHADENQCVQLQVSMSFEARRFPSQDQVTIEVDRGHRGVQACFKCSDSSLGGHSNIQESDSLYGTRLGNVWGDMSMVGRFRAVKGLSVVLHHPSHFTVYVNYIPPSMSITVMQILTSLSACRRGSSHL
jgi:hypothetical protein